MEPQLGPALSEQNQSLLQQIGRLSQLQKDNRELSNRLDQANQSAMLESNRWEDLVRTRAREQTANQLQAAANPPTASQASPSATTSVDDLPKTSWSNAGFATPQAALQTRGWAVLSGDRQLFKQSLSVTDEARKFAEDALVQMAQTSNDPNKSQYIRQILGNQYGVEEGILLAMMAENQSKTYTGYRILSQESPSPDEMVLNVETEMASAPPETQTLKFQRVGSDWKVLIDLPTVQHLLNP